MKNSLYRKLFLCFSLALFVFIILVGGLFGYLFQQRSENFYAQRLTSLAVAMAGSIDDGEIFAFNGKRPPRNPSVARRIRDLSRISDGEIWIVDKNTRSILRSDKDNPPKYDAFPKDAGKILETVLSGETAVSRSFSSLLSTPSITVGAPIFDKNGEVKGALLLHGATSGLYAVQREAFILFAAALAFGFIITLIFSAVLAKMFVKPLKSMEEFAKNLAREQYYLRSGIKKEDEIGSLAKSLDLLASRLEEIQKEKNRLEKMRQDFLTGVSHELKTPITVLRGILEMLLAGLVKTDEQRENCFKQMEKNILGLQRLVQDLFELSRLQNADFKTEKSELNLIDPLKDAIQSAKQIKSEKNISINITGKTCPIILLGDYGRLKQMFLTVLDNAVKFSPVGGEVTVNVENIGDLFEISIADQGEGIDKEILPYIFEKFHSQKSKKNDDGTGLGLAIAREIANRHDIKIISESEKDKGTRFIFKAYIA